MKGKFGKTPNFEWDKHHKKPDWDQRIRDSQKQRRREVVEMLNDWRNRGGILMLLGPQDYRGLSPEKLGQRQYNIRLTTFKSFWPKDTRLPPFPPYYPRVLEIAGTIENVENNEDQLEKRRKEIWDKIYDYTAWGGEMRVFDRVDNRTTYLSLVTKDNLRDAKAQIKARDPNLKDKDIDDVLKTLGMKNGPLPWPYGHVEEDLFRKDPNNRDMKVVWNAAFRSPRPDWDMLPGDMDLKVT
jgi:hypothetical protein